MEREDVKQENAGSANERHHDTSFLADVSVEPHRDENCCGEPSAAVIYSPWMRRPSFRGKA